MTAPFTPMSLIDRDQRIHRRRGNTRSDVPRDGASESLVQGNRPGGRAARGLPTVNAPSLSLQCLTVRTRIPSLVDDLSWAEHGHDGPNGREGVGRGNETERDLDHISVCLRCQADVAAYRRLHRQLRDFRTHHEPVDADHIEQLLTHIRPTASVHRLPRYRRRWVGDHWPMLLGGAAATLTAAGAAVAVVIARVVQRPVLSS